MERGSTRAMKQNRQSRETEGGGEGEREGENEWSGASGSVTVSIGRVLPRGNWRVRRGGLGGLGWPGG